MRLDVRFAVATFLQRQILCRGTPRLQPDRFLMLIVSTIKFLKRNKQQHSVHHMCLEFSFETAMTEEK